jgi:hypothetical protein
VSFQRRIEDEGVLVREITGELHGLIAMVWIWDLVEGMMG